MVKKPFLYRQIAKSVRQDILQNNLLPGDRLPPVREMAERWQCTIGTVQRAYEELVGQGLVVSRPGQGTHVAEAAPVQQLAPLRWARLVHLAEKFLLEAMSAGHSPAEIERAVGIALERWRILNQQAADWPKQTLRFAGSHDPALDLITAHFADFAPEHTLQLTYSGSLGGLIALTEGEADLAGAHLRDTGSDQYNVSYVQRLLPGRRVALLTLANRRLGLAVAPGNPAQVSTLADVARANVRFINRQRGAGTRVWLDEQLHAQNISTSDVDGYQQEVQTHSAVAQAVVEQKADVGLLVESTALAYSLEFIPLTTERYDLVIPTETWERPPVQALAHWLTTTSTQQKIEQLGGYDVSVTGQVTWVEQL